MGIVRGESCPGGNCPELELFRVGNEFFSFKKNRMGIVRGESWAGGNYPKLELFRVGIFREGVVQLPRYLQIYIHICLKTC